MAQGRAVSKSAARAAHSKATGHQQPGTTSWPMVDVRLMSQCDTLRTGMKQLASMWASSRQLVHHRLSHAALKHP